MKKLFILFILLVTSAFCFAFDCSYYFPLKKGSYWVYKNQKYEYTYTVKLEDIKTDGLIKYLYFNEYNSKNELIEHKIYISDTNNSFLCLYTDFNKNYQLQESDIPNKTHFILSDIGTKTDFEENYEVFHYKVEKNNIDLYSEDVNNFNYKGCLKVSEVIEVKSSKDNLTHYIQKIYSYYAPNVGLVYTEYQIYDTNGELKTKNPDILVNYCIPE